MQTQQKDSILKSLFARVWALWALISFAGTFLIIFLPTMVTYLIPNPKGQAIFINLSRIWMNVWLTLVGCSFSIKGQENVPKGQTFIFTCNHNTLLDIPITCPYIPGANRTIAKKSFAKIPLFGWFYAKGSVLIDRNSNASRIKSYEDMKATLEEKMHMCIYPEGTRNRTKEPLKKFYDGAFKLAVNTNTSIVPTLLFNTNKAMPNNKFFYFLPHKLSIHFLPPVSTEGLKSDELKDKVFQIMTNYYTANQL
jgi:1-acyl-sn-glycerol-3-phosphate acyltransferase